MAVNYCDDEPNEPPKGGFTHLKNLLGGEEGLQKWVDRTSELAFERVKDTLSQSDFVTEDELAQLVAPTEIAPRAAFMPSREREPYLKRVIRGYVSDFARQTENETPALNRNRERREGRGDPWPDMPIKVSRRTMEHVPEERRQVYLDALNPTYYHTAAFLNGLLDRVDDTRTKIVMKIVAATILDTVKVFEEEYEKTGDSHAPHASVHDDPTSLINFVVGTRMTKKLHDR